MKPSTEYVEFQWSLLDSDRLLSECDVLTKFVSTASLIVPGQILLNRICWPRSSRLIRYLADCWNLQLCQQNNFNQAASLGQHLKIDICSLIFQTHLFNE